MTQRNFGTWGPGLSCILKGFFSDTVPNLTHEVALRGFAWYEDLHGPQMLGANRGPKYFGRRTVFSLLWSGKFGPHYAFVHDYDWTRFS